MKYLTIALLALACNANAEPIAVVPIRGGEVTLTDADGYRSFSPAEAFESGYTEIK